MPGTPVSQLLIAALTVVALLGGAPARTEDLPPPIADTELDGMRGGFLVADGIEFNFGALTQTLVNGQLAFLTQVTWTAGGAQVTQVVGPNAVQGAAVNAGQIAGLQLQGLTPDQVAVLNGGATAVIEKVTNGTVQNIVLNTASGQTISQSTQLTLSLPGFAQTQQAFQQNIASLHLMQAVQAGMAPTLGH
jgi:hypothetical protein